ncbi:hypothetical protein QFZ88_005432 [Mesorhizobium sp. YL-MeA3-2017]|uniref:hypothetical protein n=1 Tax=Mesorhizobium sp. YL-MeA3-2017 TaxID=3042284 RepID=UPI0015C8E4EB|nr:hypothetical protein [Mesorhizobium sp. YL-MeA3-2017]MDQ0333050.1 hypothetical protein [Mesorhizobium sp. YL-MeA3-2017]
MTVAELLKDKGIQTAVIIDDAYDDVPKASDLDVDAWSTFFADAGVHEDVLAEIFPGYEQIDGSELIHNDAFVEAVWQGKAKLEGLASELFTDYENNKKSDTKFLADLEAALGALGITPIRMGRTVVDAARKADLIFADLFLGNLQAPDDIAQSIALVKELMAERQASPPPVVLMSRSNLLNDKRADFRDQAKLLGALFRFYRKDELLKGDNLPRTLQRLATHLADAVKIATFLSNYEASLNGATARFFKTVRRLDLSDYGEISQLLLNFEGQPLGSYLLDVFDSALTYEIEADAPTIEAARALKDVDLSLYPAPHIAGTSDLQHLVHQTVWQHRARLGVVTNKLEPSIAFGDVFLRRDYPAASQDKDVRDAFIVMTPACDLVREDGTKRILLLAGDVTPLTHTSWDYGNTLTTPLGRLEDGSAIRLQWDAKDLRSESRATIGKMLAADGAYFLFQRMRENYALDLQQSLLTRLGRVGLPAKMPATFPVAVTVSYFDDTKTLQTLNLPTLAQDGAVCYLGRDDGNAENARLVMTEAAIDELMAAIAAIPDEKVMPKGKDPLKALKSTDALARLLQTGLPLGKLAGGYGEIRSPDKPADGTKPPLLGFITRNPEAKDNNQNGGVLIKVEHDSVFIAANADASIEEPAVVEEDVATA